MDYGTKPALDAGEEGIGQTMASTRNTPVRRRRARGLLAVLPLAGLLAGACSGDNLFNEGALDLQPQLNTLNVPDAVAGQQLDILVEATAVRGVAQIIMSFRGAVTKDTVVEISPPTPNVSEVVSIEIPATPADDELFVQARVVDGLGKTSRIVEVVAQVAVPAPIAAAAATETWSGIVAIAVSPRGAPARLLTSMAPALTRAGPAQAPDPRPWQGRAGRAG